MTPIQFQLFVLFHVTVTLLNLYLIHFALRKLKDHDERQTATEVCVDVLLQEARKGNRASNLKSCRVKT